MTGIFKINNNEVFGSDGTFSGTIGSGAVFPTKSLLNLNSALVNAGDATIYSSATTVTPSSFQPTITSGNDVIIWISFIMNKRSGGHTGGYADIHLQGGGLGTGTSGKEIVEAGAYASDEYSRMQYSTTVIDSNPGGTTPTYSLYYNHVGGSARITNIYAVWGEIKG